MYYTNFFEAGYQMKKENPVFTGAGTAIVTPFKNDLVDYEALGKLIDSQIAAGIDAIVVCGTTGEASTLTDEEHRDVIKFTVERVNKRVPVIAGTGSNDYAYAVDLSQHACEVGADALLHVTPYYNKASQLGLVKYFSKIADNVSKPVILYNVPSRTGCAIGIDAYKELAQHPNIVATKEACGDISFIVKLFHAVGDLIDIYSGNDDQIVPIMSLGGKGVISVLSNIAPAKTVEMAHACLNGDFRTGAELQLEYLDLINALFMTVNPIPVKVAMSMLGICEDELRLPLCTMTDKENEKLRKVLDQYGGRIK